MNRTAFQHFLRGPAYIIDSECELLGRFAEISQGPVVEIGCAWGGSTVILLYHTSLELPVISIDPFVKDSMSDFQADRKTCEKGVATSMLALADCDHLKRWKLYVSTSLEYVQSLPSTFKAGLVFVDGDHLYEAVRDDVEAWLPHILPGGFLLLHDSNKQGDGEAYNAGWPGPTQVAKELHDDKRVQFLTLANSLTVWKKN